MLTNNLVWAVHLRSICCREGSTEQGWASSMLAGMHCMWHMQSCGLVLLLLLVAHRRGSTLKNLAPKHPMQAAFVHLRACCLLPALLALVACCQLFLIQLILPFSAVTHSQHFSIQATGLGVYGHLWSL